jgi:hypothetical protein
MAQSLSLKSAAAALTSVVVTRSFCIGVAVVLQFSGTALGEGTYQRTKDGKTIVWNNDPKPGDAATWSGRRDAEGYAAKFGTLTWYAASGGVYVRFYGNMVRGKFDGVVNGHSNRKIAHAVFADGQRTSRWATGPARSFSAVPIPQVGPTEKLAKTKNPELQNLSSANRDGEQTSRPSKRPKPEDVTEPAVPPAPTVDNVGGGGSAAPTVENAPERTAQIQNATAKESSPQPAPSAAPAASAENTPVADGLRQGQPDAPAEGPRVEVDLAATSPPSTEQTSTPNSERLGEQQNQPPIEDKDKASSLIQSEEDAQNRPVISEQKIEPEGSPQSFTEPPLSLENQAVSPQARPRLTSEEVIKLANGEARKHGYNRSDYWRDEEPRFNAEYKTWLVSYEQSTADGIVSKRFNVVVDDKTKGTILLQRQ